MVGIAYWQHVQAWIHVVEADQRSVLGQRAQFGLHACIHTRQHAHVCEYVAQCLAVPEAVVPVRRLLAAYALQQTARNMTHRWDTRRPCRPRCPTCHSSSCKCARVVEVYDTDSDDEARGDGRRYTTNE